MPLLPTLLQALAYVSRACGFETIDSFPPGHRYARTSWDRAYFDIASDCKPEQIERALCAAIRNTPLIFAHITHPTPRMQGALLELIDMQQRRSCGNPDELVTLLIRAYRSGATPEAIPGLRAVITSDRYGGPAERARAVLDFLGTMPMVIEAAP